jgi:TPR repeat protein
MNFNWASAQHTDAEKHPCFPQAALVPSWLTAAASQLSTFNLQLSTRSCLISCAVWVTLVLSSSLLHPTVIRAAEPFTMESAQSAAANGDAQALYFLGKQYAKGTLVPRDYAKAIEYLRQAAERGNAFAENDLGAIYAKGLGVQQDLAEAARWYHKAAQHGDSLAQFSLGRAYAEGRGVATNVAESLKWYQKAAAQNQPDALLALGDIYLNGADGVRPDSSEAFKCFQKAFAQGRIGALNSMGYIYEHGGALDERGARLGPSPERAVECYRQAALKGDGRAQMNLGRMYLDGFGVKADLVEAYKWFLLARSHGEPTITKYLWDLETTDQLTDAQRAEAHRRAEEFSAK